MTTKTKYNGKTLKHGFARIYTDGGQTASRKSKVGGRKGLQKQRRNAWILTRQKKGAQDDNKNEDNGKTLRHGFARKRQSEVESRRSEGTAEATAKAVEGRKGLQRQRQSEVES